MDALDDAMRERRRELEDALISIVDIEESIGVPVEELVRILYSYCDEDHLEFLEGKED
jgi:hypothetical protein